MLVDPRPSFTKFWLSVFIIDKVVILFCFFMRNPVVEGGNWHSGRRHCYTFRFKLGAFLNLHPWLAARGRATRREGPHLFAAAYKLISIGLTKLFVSSFYYSLKTDAPRPAHSFIFSLDIWMWNAKHGQCYTKEYHHCVFYNTLFVLNLCSIYYDSCETIIIERLAPCSWRWRRLFHLSLCSIQPTRQLVSRFLKINLRDSVIRKYYSY